MPYLIDGHNLIPHIPGLSLSEIDDEPRLIGWLQAFSRARRKPVEVYFDGAPIGQPASQRFGQVTAHFVRVGTTADDAIRLRLGRLGRAARNWTVVSSDHQVQAEARQAHAQVLSSEDFARQLEQISASSASPGSPGETLSPQDLRAWMKLFGIEDDDEGE